MYYAILFKEWLKIRWAFLAMSAVFLLVLINIGVNVNHTMKFVDASGFWYAVIFQGYQFYDWLLYVPVLSGVVVAFFQFMPEFSANRLKLTFHLPIRENVAIMEMLSAGFISLFSLFLVSLTILALISRIYFPVEISNSALLTVMPWFIAGLVAYFIVSTIILEPLWRQRIILIAVAYGFVNLFFAGGWYNVYRESLFILILLTLLLSLSILYSGYRFRKGVQ